MRLINVETLKLETFNDGNVPPYAILSHTWGPDEEEVSFEDIQNGNLPDSSSGVRKLNGCRSQALIRDRLKYAWIDTCCINKQSSRELEEAINSMFQWYKRAAVCYTYLSDVPGDDDYRHPGSKFSSSRWFQRGWTLQELLAPKTLNFYNQEWGFIGTKADLFRPIEAITGISRSFLLGWEHLQQASIAQRMSWAAKRRTTRQEDTAYCLLGIFNVTMSMIYGEGHHAMHRLQEEIMKKTGDHSILAWGLEKSIAQPPTDGLSAGVLAAAPSNFANCGYIVPRKSETISADGFRISGGRLSIRLSLHTTAAEGTFGLLQCGPQDNTDQVVGIPLQETNPGAEQDDYFRPQGHCPVLLSRSEISISLAKQINIQMERQNRADEAPGQRFWLHIEGHDEVGLKPEGYYPAIAWENGRAVMATLGESDTRTIRQIVRFRPVSGHPRDIAVVLEFDPQSSSPGARLHVMDFDRNLSNLKALSQALVHMRPDVFGRSVATVGVFRVKASVEVRTVAQEPVFFLKLALGSAASAVFEHFDDELYVAKLKHRFYICLSDTERSRQKANRFAKQKDKKSTALSQVRERLGVIEEQLRQLEEEKKRLSDQEREATQHIDELVYNLETAVKEQHNGREEQEAIRQRLDEFDISHGPGNWLEILFQKLYDLGDIAGSRKGERDTGPPQFLGASEGGQPPSHWTPLLWAARYGDLMIAELLLEKGADIEATDKNGYTPLSWAAQRGYEAIARLLLEKGADIEARIKDGLTPLSLAAVNGREPITRLLLENGADIETKSKEEETPLSFAAVHGRETITRLLLEKGANIEAKDKEGNTPLSLAAGNGYEAVVRVLINNRANIEAENRSYRTPAFLAAKYGHDAVVLLIFQNAGEDSARRLARGLPSDYQLPQELEQFVHDGFASLTAGAFSNKPTEISAFSTAGTSYTKSTESPRRSSKFILRKKG